MIEVAQNQNWLVPQIGAVADQPDAHQRRPCQQPVNQLPRRRVAQDQNRAADRQQGEMRGKRGALLKGKHRHEDQPQPGQR